MTGLKSFFYQCAGTNWQWNYPEFSKDLRLPVAADLWHCQCTESHDGCSWSASALRQQPLAANWVCSIKFGDWQCEQLLINSDTMGGCRVLTPAAPRQEFASSGILLLKKGGTFVSLEFSAGVSGELFWCGVWENGSVSNFRAEIRERFADREKLPEIAWEIHCADKPQVLLEKWVQRHYPQKNQRAGLAAAAWSSWDYYRWSVTAEDVLDNAEFIARDPVLSKHIKRIVIDDGWMNCYGEWEPNSRFKDMPKLVKELNKMKFSAGLWFAPGIAEAQSIIAQKHWHWLARGESSWPCMAFECMTRRGFLLDPTRAEVQKYLRELFRHYRAMGFDYFKLDFLKHTLKASKFSNRYADAAEIIRSLIRPIREGVGSNAILMGCNYLFPAGNEYLDIVRCASDIHADFNSIQHNSTSIAARLAMHNKAWINDPDFALARGCDTSCDPDMDLLRPNQVYIQAAADKHDDFYGQWSCAGSMSSNEAEILLSLVLISGGEMTFSDAMFKLNDQGLELVRKAAAAPRGAPGRAEDLLQEEYVRIFTQQVNDRHWRKLWINWQVEEQTIKLEKLPGVPGKVTDFWHGTELVINQNSVLPGRSCLLLDIYC